MRKTAPGPSRDPAIWSAQILRATVFPTKPVEVDGLKWWEELIGHVPDTTVSRPKAGELKEQGQYEGSNLTLSVSPTRVDWWYTGVSDSEREEENPFSVMGTFPEGLGSFRPLMLRWLDSSCPAIRRLAFGATLVRSVETREDGYRFLAPYLPRVALDPEGSSDFSYQINRPRESSVLSGLRLNRLSKWYVSLTRVHTIEAGLAGEPQVRRSEPQHAALLEVDINTAAEFEGSLPSDRLAPLLEELIGLGVELALEGDIP